MKRVNNNNLLGVIQTHRSALFYSCVSKVAHRGLRGSVQHITGKARRVTGNFLHPNSLHSSQIQIRGIGRFDWFANHLPGIRSVLSQIRCVEGGQGAHRGAVSLNSIASDSFIDMQLIITCQACPPSELIDHSVIPYKSGVRRASRLW